MNTDHDLSLDSQLCYALYSTMLVLGKVYALVLGNCSPPLSTKNALSVNGIAFPMNKAASVT